MINITLASPMTQDATAEAMGAITPAASVAAADTQTNPMLVKVRNRELMRDTLRKTTNCLKLLQSTQATLEHLRRQRSDDE